MELLDMPGLWDLEEYSLLSKIKRRLEGGSELGFSKYRAWVQSGREEVVLM